MQQHRPVGRGESASRIGQGVPQACQNNLMQHTTDKEEREKYERHQKASARKEHVSGGAGDEAQRILSRPSPSGKTGDANPRADKLPFWLRRWAAVLMPYFKTIWSRCGGD